jgi:haloalkane dehalogenase
MGEYQTLKQHDVTLDGWRVHYVDAGAGPPVVMVHGSPVSSYAFREQIAALAPRFRVVAPDLLGFGQSEGPEEGASFQQHAAMLCALLDHLLLGPFRLVGHDWGGPIGLGCAAKRPEQVRQLVLINTTILADFKPPGYWKPFTTRGVGELLLVRANVFSRGLPFLMQSARSQEVRQAYARPLKGVGPRRTILALERLEGYGELMREVEAALPSLSQLPTLIIWGQPDVYFRLHELQRLKEVFPDAIVREIPGGGHFPQEDAPEAVTAALLDFLE